MKELINLYNFKIDENITNCDNIFKSIDRSKYSEDIIRDFNDIIDFLTLNKSICYKILSDHTFYKAKIELK